MSGDELRMNTVEVAAAGGAAAGAAGSSAFSGIVPPPKTSTSLLDGALSALSSNIETLLTKENAADIKEATEQSAMLEQSPPLLVQQDQSGAGEIASSVGGRQWYT
ncbi:hypothetical protein [Mycobacteroides abscessus]|uniref:hypothetical protein n=1 Tax=Mycobacteroides abscessus TaxID=36809 RepID=UPI002103B63D|nr:hypothetical protein [Mycobacteroides abscessus]